MIALDTETTGVDFQHGSRPYLVTICDEDSNVEWWEWQVNPRTRKPFIPKRDIEEIKERIEGETVVFQNRNFDVRALETIGIGPIWQEEHDTLIAAHLLCSYLPKDLTTLAVRYLGLDISTYEAKMEKATQKARNLVRRKFPKWRLANDDQPDMPSAKEKTWKLDCWLLRTLATKLEYEEDHKWWTLTSDYANVDSESTILIWLKIREILEERNLWKIYKERMKILPIIYGMESRGVHIDPERTDQLYEEYDQEIKQLEARNYEIAKEAGFEDLKIPKGTTNNSLKEFLFGHWGIDVIKTTKTGEPGMDSETLQSYTEQLEDETQIEFIKNLTDRSSRITARSYMDGYRRFMLPTPAGFHIYPKLNPTGTDTLRCSSKNPNEQNISKKKGFNLRYCFGPPPGYEWWAIDYNNLELRIPAYGAEETQMIELFEQPDAAPYYGSNHLLNFSKIYPEIWQAALKEHGEEGVGEYVKEELKATYYRWCKNTGFAIQYGAGQKKTDATAHRKGAYKALKSAFNRLTDYNNHWVSMANQKGYIETMIDYEVDPERGYPLWLRKSFNRIKPTQPLSYHVQGTACWIMIRAMTKVEDLFQLWNRKRRTKKYSIALQVHDELVLQMPYKPNLANRKRAKVVAKVMASIGDAVRVPLTCGIDYHEHNWSGGVAI